MKRVLLIALAICAALPAAATQLNTNTSLQDQQPSQDITAPAPTVTDPRFDRAIDDLPLMPGLSSVPEEETVFVTPRSGRIADSKAQGTVDIDDIYVFYRRTLPQLGWRKLDARSFIRNNEILRIDAHADGKLTTVHFTIRPH